MTICISIGKWGGIYWFSGFTKRLCLGWIALTYIPVDDIYAKRFELGDD